MDIAAVEGTIPGKGIVYCKDQSVYVVFAGDVNLCALLCDCICSLSLYTGAGKCCDSKLMGDTEYLQYPALHTFYNWIVYT